VSLINFSFLPKECNINILNSGGPDSAILIYRLAEFLSEHKDTHSIKVYHITANTTEKLFYQHFAKQVINAVEEKFDVNICEEHILYDTEVFEFKREGRTIIHGYGSSMKEVARNLYKEKNCIYTLSGFSMHYTADKYEDKNMHSRRDKSRCPEYSEGRDIFTIDPVHDGMTWYFPFAKSTKKEIRQEYDDFALEHIFPITRSCEAMPNLPEFVPLGHCGKCLHCTERKMAFGRL
jgi:hypothetical protein